MEKAMATHSNTLAWKIPWMEEPARLQSMWLLRLSHFTFTFHFHALQKEMATHSSVLAWRIPGMGESGRLLSMGSHRVGHYWSDLAAAAAAAERMTGRASVWIKTVFFYKQGSISNNIKMNTVLRYSVELCITLKSHTYTEHSFCTIGL